MRPLANTNLPLPKVGFSVAVDLEARKATKQGCCGYQRVLTGHSDAVIATFI